MSQEDIGIAVAVLVIGSFILCILLFILSSFGFNVLSYEDDMKSEREKRAERERAEMEKSIQKINAERAKIRADLEAKKAHKVRTQYPPPETKEDTFVVTNIKDSVLVTEVVYAD